MDEEGLHRPAMAALRAALGEPPLPPQDEDTPTTAQRSFWRARLEAALQAGSLADTADTWRALLRHDRRDGTLTVEFEPSPDQLVVDVRASGETDDEAGAGGDPAPDDPGDQERFARIVADVVDRFDVDDTGSHIRLVKSHTPVD